MNRPMKSLIVSVGMLLLCAAVPSCAKKRHLDTPVVVPAPPRDPAADPGPTDRREPYVVDIQVPEETGTEGSATRD